jgi:hypothetical protein
LRVSYGDLNVNVKSVRGSLGTPIPLVAARLAGGGVFKIADAGKPDCYG